MKYSLWRMEPLFKLAAYDIKSLLRENRAKICVFTILCILISLLCINQMAGKGATVLDYICFIVGGPKHIPPGMLELYNIPVPWLSIQAMIAYIIGYYAVTDLHTYGMQVLIRSGERKKWWISKCICNVAAVTLLYAILYGVAVIAAFLSGARFSMELTPEIATTVCNLSSFGGTTDEVCFILLCMPLIVSCAISMAQMSAAFITSPVIAFLASQSIVFLSTIYEYKFLILNYGMLSHNRITCMSAIKCSEGVVICLMVWILSAAAGMLYFMGCNILPKQAGEGN